ncbi:hypothetical protein COOONC_23163 [Cooperia oncophora]
MRSAKIIHSSSREVPIDIGTPSGLGRCSICRQLFPVFTDYEAHIEDGCCLNTPPILVCPIHVEMSDSGNIPLNYDLSPIPKCETAAKSRVMICSLCHDDRFASVTKFHEHIIDCARKLAACSEY